MRTTIAAPAKVNLRLRVGPREDSGYHRLSTLFCTLDLADTVMLREPRPDDSARLEVAFAPPLKALPDLGDDDDNLAVRAARLFLERARPGGADVEAPHVRLLKRIPAGGGLGGGSSDAGAVLRAMRRLHPRTATADELLRMAADIGSDVPFFTLGTPLARAGGRGEVLTALPPLPPRPVVLVVPPFPLTTADVFRWLDEDRDEESLQPAMAAPEEVPAPGNGSATRLTWDDVAEEAVNDLEGPVFRRYPRLQELRDELRAHGARLALLAGSGSTVFGVFDDRTAAGEAARSLRGSASDHRVVLTGTRTR